MDKLNKIEIANLYQDKVLSIILMTINTLLCYNFIPNDFETFGEKIIFLIPIITLLFSGYACAYKLKNNMVKIVYAILIIVSVLILGCYWYIIQLGKAFKN
ncbi:hypothetical protein SL053_002117 [Flavobacterium psychrophilum]|nr:hypothetical protein [Flavobacterium psychrophilum]